MLLDNRAGWLLLVVAGFIFTGVILLRLSNRWACWRPCGVIDKKKAVNWILMRMRLLPVQRFRQHRLPARSNDLIWSCCSASRFSM